MDAAERVFFSKGFHATMEEIAAEARLGKGTIYLYFPGKEDIYLALMCKGLDILGGLFRGIADGPGSVVDKALGIGREFVRFHDDFPDFFKILHETPIPMADGQISPDMLETLHKSSAGIWEVLTGMLQEGIDQDVFRSDISAFEMAVILWTNTSGLLRQIDIMKSTSLWSSNRSVYSLRTLGFERLISASRTMLLDALMK